MAETNSSSSVEHIEPFLPPPPPPVPPPPISVKNISEEAIKSKGQIVNRHAESLTADEQGRKAYKNLLTQGFLPQEKEFACLSCYSPVKPVLQNGPVCGLVALSMASQLSNKNHVTTDDIFLEAQRRGYSKQGEMFSVLYLQELASEFLSCSTEYLHLNRDKKSKHIVHEPIVKHLLQKQVLLMPYDADKNHSPCQKRGHKAHWALITGVVLVFSDPRNLPPSVKSVCRKDPEISSLFHWPEDPTSCLYEELASSIAAVQCQEARTSPCCKVDLYVYGHQGKSKHAGLWSLNEVLESNGQLEEAGPERGVEDYVFPRGGVASGLKSQILVVNRKKL